MVERFAARTRGLHRDREIFFYARLPDVVFEALRADAGLDALVLIEGASGNQPMSRVVHLFRLLSFISLAHSIRRIAGGGSRAFLHRGAAKLLQRGAKHRIKVRRASRRAAELFEDAFYGTNIVTQVYQC